ncbi:ACP S-malonyltransferase [Carnobacterium gallinarum]|uniref:ACP S-malonyltransferase n=1 Tax=Carnobacterium gallinarum TaxID=2749 RepID=UPI0006922072|nr:acyltransferase domain-containing protein [Carnobacterium gallinarum]
MELTFTFPGQGSQYKGMLQQLPKQQLDLVADLTGFQLQDTEDTYHSIVGIQLALLSIETHYGRQLKAAGFHPKQVAGHSIGAFSGAVLAEAISLEAAILIVYQRATLMAQAYPQDYGMGVVTGLFQEELSPLVQQIHSLKMPVYLSNQNAPQQIALSGYLPAIDAVLALAKANGAAKAIRLNVPVPSHCPLMQEVADELLKEIKKITIKDPNCLYLANHTGRGVRQAHLVAEDLVQNIVYPVKWSEMMQASKEHGYGPQVKVELPPGQTLTKLGETSESNVRWISMDRLGLEGTSYLLTKWKEQEND